MSEVTKKEEQVTFGFAKAMTFGPVPIVGIMGPYTGKLKLVDIDAMIRHYNIPVKFTNETGSVNCMIEMSKSPSCPIKRKHEEGITGVSALISILKDNGFEIDKYTGYLKKIVVTDKDVEEVVVPPVIEAPVEVVEPVVAEEEVVVEVVEPVVAEESKEEIVDHRTKKNNFKNK